MKRIRILGVCAGNGVILHPFLKSKRFQILGNLEPRPIFHTPGENQWRANFGELPMNRVLSGMKKVSVIVGHPDCGNNSRLSYSRAKRLTNSMENDSFNTFIEAIQTYKPQVFLLENLPKLLDSFEGKSFENLFPGYKLVFHNEVSMSELGNSQRTRIRLIVIGIRKSLRSSLVNYFSKLRRMNIERTTSELLHGLTYPDHTLCHIRENIESEITIYAKKKLGLKEIQRLWNEDFKGLKKWPIPNSKMKSAPGVYRNLSDYHPMTVRKGNREFNPEGLMMTPRERARIQGIPDEFKLYFDEAKPGYWINKGRTSATKGPPYELGLWFKKCLLRAFFPRIRIRSHIAQARILS